MTKTLRVKNIGGGTAPYKFGILGHRAAASVTEFAGLPNGIVRGYIEDATGKRSFVKQDKIKDPAYNTDKRVNWENIPTFTLPYSIDLCVYGYGAPRWKNEATPADNLLRGWTHTDNGLITSTSVLPETKRANFQTWDRNMFNDSVMDIIGVNPGAVNAIVVQSYVLNNPGASVRSVTYKNYANANVTVNIAAGGSASIQAKYGTFTPSSDDEVTDEMGTPYNWPACSDADLIMIGRSLQWRFCVQPNFDTDLNNVYARVLMWDEEVWGNVERFHAKIIEGFIAETKVLNRTCKVVWYGKVFHALGIGTYSQISGGNWKTKYFPWLSSALMAQRFRVSSYINQVNSAVDNLYIDSAFYFKCPLPETQTRYHKQNGQYVLDVDGDRVVRKEDFTEVIRGETVKFYRKPVFGGHPPAILADAGYGYTDNIVPEMYFAIEQFYLQASRMICLLVGLKYRESANEDIYGDLSTMKVKVCPVIRNETEPITHGGYAFEIRPLTTWQLEWWVFTSLIIAENMYLWTDYYNQTKANGQNKNSGTYVIPFRNPTGTAYWDFSSIEELTSSLSVVADLHAKHDIWGGTSKRCIFYNPFDTTHEIMAWGRLKDNRLLIHLCDSRLDYDEVMTVQIKNKKNNYTQTVTVRGNQNFIDVFYLPAGTYVPSDIYIEYNDLYGQLHKCSGDLRSHTVA